MATKDEKALARRFYDTALKDLRFAQNHFADMLVRRGKDYQKHPQHSTSAKGLIRRLEVAANSIGAAEAAYRRALDAAVKAKVSHPGDKYGGKLKDGKHV